MTAEGSWSVLGCQWLYFLCCCIVHAGSRSLPHQHLSLSSSLPPSPSALPDSTINSPTHLFAHAHTHTCTHQSIQACLALPKPKMTIDFPSSLPLNYANLWFMFRYFFGIPTPDTGWGFPPRPGWKDSAVDSRRRGFSDRVKLCVFDSCF